MMLILCAMICAGDPVPDALTLRARAALVLTRGEIPRPTYAEQYTQAVKQNQPLIVWVGLDPQAIPGCLHHACRDFPDAPARGVVIGIPRGKRLERVDLAGEPSPAQIEAALRQSSAAVLPRCPDCPVADPRQIRASHAGRD